MAESGDGKLKVDFRLPSEDELIADISRLAEIFEQNRGASARALAGRVIVAMGQKNLFLARSETPEYCDGGPLGVNTSFERPFGP